MISHNCNRSTKAIACGDSVYSSCNVGEWLTFKYVNLANIADAAGRSDGDQPPPLVGRITQDGNRDTKSVTGLFSINPT
jgi:hypothetical protein